MARATDWRSIVAAVACIVGYGVLFVAVTVGSAVVPHDLAPAMPKWLFLLVHGGLWIAGVVLVTWLLRVKINKAAWAGMALPCPGAGRFALGFAGGVAVMSLSFAAQHQLGWLNVAGVETLATAGPRIAFALIPSLGVGVAEELAFRGYLFQTLGERMPVWAAAGLSAAIFAMYHLTLGGFGPGFVATVFCLALAFTVLRIATGSLWFPIGLHAAWDWTQTYLIGVANVGQTGRHDPALVKVTQSGPALWVGQAPAIEGGLLYAIAILCVLALALAYAALRGRLPRWTRPLDEDGQALA